MSAEASGYVWKHSPYRGATLLVHLAIADVANDLHHNEFFMSVPRLAAKARVERKTCQVALHQLVEDGFLERVVTVNGADHLPNRYRCVFPPVTPVHTPALSERGEAFSEPDPPASSDRPPPVATTPTGRSENAQSQVGSQVDPKRSERAKKKPAWHTLPETELLSPERREIARQAGLHPARIAPEWQKFSMYYFARPKSDVEATWRNWVVRALDEPWSPPADPQRPKRGSEEASEPTRLGGVIDRVMSDADKTRRALDARDREAERKDRERREDVGL